ncbi:hypothetical protein KB575_00580 [Streptococcus canis]|uniref:LPD11 domain-containing protein n=1 Tax=Streptococcus canis TaxID=1329 RepID=UPI00294A072B|nr:LPD11 domain-containing protein [Streptococcus canis]MDV5987564.1 hypothetical protein [Streptococcus canis]
MAVATITNLKTGQKASFDMPFHLHKLSQIGIDENYDGQVYVLSDVDSFGYGLDGYMYLYELKAFNKDFENKQNPYHFDYMMLSRLQSDCDYYLGYGNRNEKRLWAGNVVDQIAEMKRLWQNFPDDKKPEWLTWQNILDYEERMLNDS